MMFKFIEILLNCIDLSGTTLIGMSCCNTTPRPGSQAEPLAYAIVCLVSANMRVLTVKGKFQILSTAKAAEPSFRCSTVIQLGTPARNGTIVSPLLLLQRHT